MKPSLDPRLREGPFQGSLALAEGAVTRSRLRSAEFTRLLRDVYVIAGVRVTHQLRCQAATLIIPPTAGVTGRSAATALGVPLADPWDPVHVAVPEDARFESARDLIVRRVVSSTVDLRRHEGTVLTAPERMCFDMTLGQKLGEAVADVDAALHRELLHQADLERWLTLSHERGVRHARDVLALTDPRAQSRPESLVRVLLVRDGLKPEPQLRVHHNGRFVAQVDLGFEEAKLAVEYEGRWHGDPMHVPRDRARLNRLEAAGWRVIFVTADDLRGDHRDIVDAVRLALQRSLRRLAS